MASSLRVRLFICSLTFLLPLPSLASGGVPNRFLFRQAGGVIALITCVFTVVLCSAPCDFGYYKLSPGGTVCDSCEQGYYVRSSFFHRYTSR